jgi:hypothetical protein
MSEYKVRCAVLVVVGTHLLAVVRGWSRRCVPLDILVCSSSSFLCSLGVGKSACVVQVVELRIFFFFFFFFFFFLVSLCLVF